MICSVRELGSRRRARRHLGAAAKTPGSGRPVAEALGIDDWVIEIDNKSLTHRPDLWGHRGIARELAAIYERPLLPLDTSLPATGHGAPYPVAIETAGCSRYLALPIDGVTPGPSPDWLRWLLLAVGQRPIDLLVDLSNFVMLDLGQPNHVFDRNASRRTAGPRDRRAQRPGRRDDRRPSTGKSASSMRSDLLICAGDAPVALAGIMGGEGSKVAATTDSLLLEVATFDADDDPPHLDAARACAPTPRRASRRRSTRTSRARRRATSRDCSRRSSRAARFPSPPTDAGDWSDPACVVPLRNDRVRAALGTSLSDDEIRDILERLEFGVEAHPGGKVDAYEIRVPSFRATKDITIEQDLIEEIGRIHRYGNIPEQPLQADIVPPPRDERRLLVRQLQDRLAGGARFHENLSYSFIEDDLLGKLGELELPHVAVINPVNQNESRIRRRVAPSLLPALEANRRHHTDVRLFEIGKAYEPEHANDRGEPRERHLLALAWAGTRPGKRARFDENRLMGLQAIVNDLVRLRGCGEPRWSGDGQPPAWAHPGKCLFLSLEGADEPVAVVAELEPGLAPRIGLSGDLESEVAIAEICLDALLAARPSGAGYRPLPRFPGIKVDVAASVPESTSAAELIALIEQAGRKQVAGTELFDLYRGESIGPGRKSLAFHVLLQSEDKTLTDKDEQKFLQRFEKLVAEAGGELRKG